MASTLVRVLALLALTMARPIWAEEQHSNAAGALGSEARKQRAVANGRVMVGMTTDEVRKAWGQPAKIDHETNQQGHCEQWVYPYGSIIYFVNGRAVSVQTAQ
jgi:hypothetical protein